MIQKTEVHPRLQERLARVHLEIKLNIRKQREALDQLEDLLFRPSNPQVVCFPGRESLAGKGSQLEAHGRLSQVGGESFADDLVDANVSLLVLLAVYNTLCSSVDCK